MSDDREALRTGAAGEAIYGFAQAMRVGDVIHVSGQTASSDDDGTAGANGPGDVTQQMTTAYAKIAALLERFGASMANVVDETIFVTDMRTAIGAAIAVRQQVYPHFDLASTIVEVRSLAGPDLLVEIKCTAVR